MAITVRTTEELETALNELSAASGLSKQRIFHDAVMEKWERENHRAAVREIGRRVRERDRALLDRLGSS